MITALIIVSSIFAYFIIGVWTFGYVCGSCSQNNNYHAEYYYDEWQPWLGSIFWPFYLPFKLLFGRYIWMLIHHGEGKAIQHSKQKEERQVRIAEEKSERERLARVAAQEAASIDQEVEDSLKRRRALIG